jgi:two-component system response regulator DesR
VIPLILIDDHELLVDALASLLARAGSFDVVATSSSFAEGRRAREAAPDALVVADLDVPDGGREAVLDLLSDGAHLVLLSAFATTSLARELLAAGARGVLSKGLPLSTLAPALVAAWSGVCVLDPAIARAIEPQPCPLSSRELRVLHAARDGAPIAQVALRVHLAPGTTRNLLSHAIQALGVRNRHEAVSLAQERGWI